MFIFKHLYLTSALYAGFLVLAVMGHVQWRRSYRADRARPARRRAGRRDVTRRIVLTGPEATGKTTLAAALARRLRRAVAARGLARLRGGSEARAHRRRRGGRSRRARSPRRTPRSRRIRRCSCSTPTSSAPWCTRGITTAPCPGWIEDAARARRGDLYLLCAPDLPWTADGVRDRPANREEMFALFEGALREFGCVSADVSGTGPARERAALAAVTALVAAAGHR